MIRKIIKIDESKCNGCGACAAACHEGAIEMIDGVAKLTREDYCDGLGDCLPACPVDAITFEEREAPAYDEEAVLRNKAEKEAAAAAGCSCSDPAGEVPLPCGCAGSESRSFDRRRWEDEDDLSNCDAYLSDNSCCCGCSDMDAYDEPYVPSQLRQWPVQIKLVPVNAPYFDGAHLLVAADCTAYAYGNFHNDFIKDRITLIGCTKLDDVDYTEKLAQIIQKNDIKSIVVTRMQVPCCGGMEMTVKRAVELSGKKLHVDVVIISSEGDIVQVR